MKYSYQNPEPNNFITKRLAVWAITSVVAVSLPFILQTKTAHASLFSFLTSLLEGQKASAQIDEATSSSNSQTIALLQAATNIDPNPVKHSEATPIGSGETLIADIAMASDTSDDAPVNTEISVYTVQSGDTISSVAKMFGVSVNTVLWSNNLTGKSVLRAGQSLVILPISGLTHIVKKGDTIQGIVNKYKADLGDVLAYNDLSVSSALTIGQTILIPNVEATILTPIRIVIGKNPAHDTNGPDYPGYYIRPIDGGTRTQGLHGYNAVDLAARVGTPIHAAADGVVIVARTGGWNGGYGSFVIVSHNNGTQTLYAHASRVLVSSGQLVSQGQTIALMGSTGESTGSHVHFEIRGARNPF